MADSLFVRSVPAPVHALFPCFFDESRHLAQVWLWTGVCLRSEVSKGEHADVSNPNSVLRSLHAALIIEVQS